MPPKPIILAFDTSAAHCAVALLSDKTVLADIRVEMAKGQAEALLPLCEDALRQASVTWNDLTAIAVCSGPGNFTGIRIAVSTARGLSLALGIPAIGVTMFEAMAFGSTEQQTLSLPARRGHVYQQEFDGHTPLAEAIMLESSDVIERPYKMPCGHSLPETLARVATLKDATLAARPAPYYIQAPDAAIPKSISPKILS